MAELLFFRDDRLQMRVSLRAPRMVLGRGNEPDLQLPDRAVSRIQCELVAKGSGHLLIDRSGRGTRVGHRVALANGTMLRDGDELRLGEFLVLYSAERAPDPDAQPEVTSPGRRSSGRRTARLGAEPSAERVRARLRLNGPDGETVVPLRAEEGFRLVIGSDPQAPQQLAIEDRFVSREHCAVAMSKGRWVLTEHQDAMNGTFVDGVRVLKCVLEGRATIRLGETTVVFEQDRTQALSLEPLPGLVTRDPAMSPLVELVRRVASSRAPVAIHGETGSGKEVIARAIHLLSDRRDGPFVALNCGAIPRETVESELFGHERGAFTGADRTRTGAFEEASGGTLFLDEIGDLPLDIQVKLLRTLERGEIRRMGSNRTLKVDVRIVSATHVDLVAAIDEGAFREDLFYRLCVVPVEVPPLRMRPADILPLAEHFVSQLAPSEVTLSPSARVKLESHPWPGNARELRNVVQAALLLRRGEVITDEDLQIRAPRRKKQTPSLKLAGRTLEEIEREAFRLALERNDWDKRAAMEELGVARSTFFRKLDEYGLARQAG